MHDDTSDVDRIERDAKDIVEAGRELEQARERELELGLEESAVDAQIQELQRKKLQLQDKKQEARATEKQEEQRIADDLRDIEEAQGEGPKKKTVTITIDTKDFELPKGKITYNRVVELAYPDFASFPNATYSILYERGAHANPQGVLSKGGSVEIVDGMRFRVKRTGES